MFKVVALILSLLFIPLQGQNYCLKESLERVETGDYIVYEASRFYTLVYVKSKQPPLMTFEEVSIATDCVASMKQGNGAFDFPEWLKEGALNSSSWVTYTFDFNKGTILRSYSHSRKSQQAPSPLLSTLLNLSCKPSVTRKMTRKGTPWNPPLLFNGEKRAETTAQWSGCWPSDGSPLAAAALTLFTAEAPLLPLPYWIELHKDQKRILLRAIASGKKALL